MSYIVKKLDFFDPIKIADSGQAFRIHRIDDKHVETVAYGKYLQISILDNNEFAFSCNESDFNNIWNTYFDLNRDYTSIVNNINKEDAYLKNAAVFGSGIRILKQELFETVISYIISQRRSIPSITTCVDKICEKYGKLIVPSVDEPFVTPLKKEYYSFPTPEELSKATTEEINDLGAGYRTPYILNAVKDFLSGKLSDEVFSNASDDEAYEILLSMNGVGPKVANCIMLFALSRYKRFPIDVWMQRIIDTYYGGSYNYSIYEEAGIMQQFMFYYERIDSKHK